MQGRGIGSLVKVGGKLKSDFKAREVIVREPGGSIGTNFGSKAHSDF